MLCYKLQTMATGPVSPGTSDSDKKTPSKASPITGNGRSARRRQAKMTYHNHGQGTVPPVAAMRDSES